jgi:hypothetical protein
LSEGIDGDETTMKRKCLFVVLLIVLLLSACGSERSNACGQIPRTEFAESDLVGTWDAVDALRDSTFIIREDRRYKQTIYVERTGFSYEGDWLPWRVEYSEEGFPYLHLEGLLMCAYWRQMDCSTAMTNIEPVDVGDTKDPFADEYYWYDYCRKEWVETPGEGVYLILEGSEGGAAAWNLAGSSYQICQRHQWSDVLAAETLSIEMD